MVTVYLYDINDNAPKCLLTSAERTIPEKLPTGSPVYQLNATDPDGIIKYRYNTTKTAVSDMKMFTLDESTGVVSTSNSKLDYEGGKSTFLLYFFATDSTFTSNEFILTIHLTDINDNSPVFDSFLYIFNVTETPLLNTFVGKVKAIDADGTASNNGVTYNVLNNQFSNLFQLNPISGEITTAGDIDREASNKHVLHVCASDNAVDNKQIIPSREMRSGCTYVLINVLDANDNKPFFNKSYYVSVFETAENIPVFTISATDSDYGNNGKVHYEMVSTVPSQFSFNNATGILTCLGNLNYETKSYYSFTVRACDSGSPQQCSALTELTVEVKDVNDNSPIFEENIYRFTVFENRTINSSIGYVKANDLDKSIANSKVEYSLFDPSNQNWFTIHADTGLIQVVHTLAAGTYPVYSFKVIATDLIGATSSSQRRHDTSLVEITIQKVRNDAPLFSLRDYSVDITEKTLKGIPIFMFSASDVNNDNITYEYSRSVAANPDQTFFSLSAIGIVSLSSTVLDRENGKNLYEIYVKGRDHTAISSTFMYSNEVALRISVKDINDNSPRFDKDLYDFDISENSADGTFIGRVSSTDDDRSIANNQVRYSIKTNIYDGLFVIDSSSGNITVKGIFLYLKSFTIMFHFILISLKKVSMQTDMLKYIFYLI